MKAPVPDVICDLILNAPGSYWTSGSGDAGLSRTQASVTSELYLAMSAERTFHLRYIRDLNVLEYLVPVLTPDLSDTTVIYLGGEPTRLPCSFFVDPQQASEAVRFFLSTGEPLPALQWVPLYEQDWNDEV